MHCLLLSPLSYPHRCCRATAEIPASCTNPLTQNRDANLGRLCPTPPRVSYDDVVIGAVGRLDSDITYVDEYLLLRAEDLAADVYSRRLLGGFVMSYSEPEFGSCSTFRDFPTPNSFLVNESFVQCAEISGTEYYSLNYPLYKSEFNDSFPWLNREDNCPALFIGSGSGSGSGQEPTVGLGSDSMVDGFSAGLIQTLICNNDALKKIIEEKDIDLDSRPPATYSSDFTQQKIAATVYYNNDVSCGVYHTVR